MNQLYLQLLNGLVVGSALALVAAGLALLFGVLDIINFAQGDFFMLGAYVLWIVNTHTNNYLLGVIAATLVVGIVAGVVLMGMLWPLMERSQALVLLATLGLSLIVEQLATNVFGGDTKLIQPPIDASVQLGPISYPLYDLVIVVVALVILGAGFFALRYAKYGIWLRAVAQNRQMAAVLGVPVPRVYAIAFIVSAGLAGLAGALLVPVTSVYPTVGGDVILNAFIIVVAGGLGNLRGAAVLALLLGEIQSLGSIVIPPVQVELFLFAAVIALMIVRSRRNTAALVRL